MHAGVDWYQSGAFIWLQLIVFVYACLDIYKLVAWVVVRLRDFCVMRSGIVHRGDGAASSLFSDYVTSAHGSSRSCC